MSPVSNISPVKAAFAVAALLSLVAVGLAIRGAASPGIPALGMVDDYATRHALEDEVELTAADDYGTRNQRAAVELTAADDFGTRNRPAAIELTAELTAADDFGTRNQRAAVELTAADDFGTRNQPAGRRAHGRRRLRHPARREGHRARPERRLGDPPGAVTQGDDPRRFGGNPA